MKNDILMKNKRFRQTETNKMPNSPQSWIVYFSHLPAEVYGVLMAIFIAILRVIYDKEETRPIRILMEALICGALSLTASYAIIALGLNMNWAIFTGGTIGYFGSATIRALSIGLIKKKLK